MLILEDQQGRKYYCRKELWKKDKDTETSIVATKLPGGRK